MRSVFSFFFFIACFFSPSGFGAAKPFHHVLVLNGGGLNIPAFVGVFDGLEKQGKKPDLIIGVCGAAYAVALLHLEPDRARRLEFLKSETFHQLITSMRFRPSLVSSTSMATAFGAIAFRNSFRPNPLIPPLFQEGFANLPQDLGKNTLLDAFFTSSAQHLPVIIQAARIDFGKQDVGHKRGDWMAKNGALFSLAYYTDPQTAKVFQPGGALADFDPNQGFERLFGKAAPFASKPIVITDQRISAAARSSVADPYYLDPYCNDKGECFVSGAADHYPFELASALADEVTVLEGTFFSSAEKIAYMDIFGFDIHKRDELARRQLSNRKVAFSDFGITQADGYNADEQGFNIRIDAKQSVQAVHSRIPVPYGPEFQTRSEKLYQYGFQRAVQAVQFERLKQTLGRVFR